MSILSSSTFSASLLSFLLILESPLSHAQAPINYERDIRPILSDNCFHCHGPDEAERKAGIRLDTKEGLFASVDNHAIVSPNNPNTSLLIHRVFSEDPDEAMPPAEAKKKFGDKERTLLKRWIEEGAQWSVHWAFVTPTKPTLPTNINDKWTRNPIDHFTEPMMQQKRLQPSVQASNETLIRRLSLDLTGLPPTPEAVETFLADTADDAYERLVDQLLASPHFGERMAWPWLDAARYSDTNGYQSDRVRTMYPWRDWVIKSFNDNMPYDQFTIWQLAGDLLPNPTKDQKIATGFNRNHMINGEGGRIAEENRVEYIFDQLETVGTVWMALTMNCSRCHDHKYDPITNEDYYRLFDYFNRTPVSGGGGDPMTAPNMIFDEGVISKLAQFDIELTTLKGKVASRIKILNQRQSNWEDEQRTKLSKVEDSWKTITILQAKALEQTLNVQTNGAILATGVNPDNDHYEIHANTNLTSIASIRLDALRHPNMTDNGLARSDSGNFVLTDFSVTLKDAQGNESPLPIDSAEATVEQGSYTIAGAIDTNYKTGWAVYEGRPIDRDHAAIFRLKEAITIDPDSILVFRLRHETYHKQHNLGHFSISLSNSENAILGDVNQQLLTLINTPTSNRTKEQKEQIKLHYYDSDFRYRKSSKKFDSTTKKRNDLYNKTGKVMIMKDSFKSRQTYMLNIGLYNQSGKEVVSGTPAVFFPKPADTPNNRLGLAKWLVDPQHPLTARVTVNRFWAQLFGQGLVKTTENFGLQGELPSHPKLLDWLAVNFLESDWDVKALMRLMVTSATYRQTSNTTPERIAIDPDNRYLSHGPRFRMPSWMIRDQALFAGGKLVPTIGGPPVKPYQPDGLWKEFSFDKIKYTQDSGDALYRRSLYTFWRRIVAPPMFFDSSTRQTCTVKATRTNTPLHALTTLNDPTYVEAARALAESLLITPDINDSDRIDTAFRISMSRSASEEELKLLLGSIQRFRMQFSADPQSAKAYLGVGESIASSEIDPIELASYASLCLSLLNTDEALTKE